MYENGSLGKPACCASRNLDSESEHSCIKRGMAVGFCSPSSGAETLAETGRPRGLAGSARQGELLGYVGPCPQGIRKTAVGEATHSYPPTSVFEFIGAHTYTNLCIQYTCTHTHIRAHTHTVLSKPVPEL